MSGLILDRDDLATLATAKRSGVNLNIEYWTPAEVGETKKLMFVGFRTAKFPDPTTGEPRDVDCVVFADQYGNVLANGSSILLSIVRDQLKQGDKIELEYAGKNKSQSGRQCDNWKVYPLQTGAKQ